MSGVNGASKKGRNYSFFVMHFNIWFCLLLVGSRVFLGKTLEDAGMAYLSIPMELFLLAMYAFSIPLSSTVAGLMKVRIKREQYRNALNVSRCGALLCLGGAILFAAITSVSCRYIANAFHMELSWMAIGVVGVAIFFCLLNCGHKGFLFAVAGKPFLLFGQVVELLFTLVGLFVGAHYGNLYGAKVAALLKSEQMIYGYSAFGATAGLALGQVASFLVWMILCFMFRSAFLARLKENSNKKTEDIRSGFGMILYNSGPVFAAAMFSQLIILVICFFFARHPGSEDAIEKMVPFWGCFYGKYLPLMMIPCGICAYNIAAHNNRVVTSFEKEDVRKLRDNVEKGLVKLNAVSVSGAILIAVLSQAIAGALFGGMTSSILKVISATSVLIVCYGYYYAAHHLLQKMQYHGESVLIMAGTFVLGIVVAFVLISKMELGLMGAAISLIMYYLIGALAAGFRIYPRLRCSFDFVRSFAYPILCAAISGIVVLLLNRLLLELAGATVTLLVGLVIGVFLDIFLLLAFHVVSENQIRKIPGGFIVVAIGRGIGII